MSDRRMLHNAEQDVIQAACRLVDASENPKKYEVGDYLEDGTELIHAVHHLHGVETAAGLRQPVTDEDEKPEDSLFVIREGMERGKGRYLKMDTHAINTKWTKKKRRRATYVLHDNAEEDAAIHGGRVVRVVPRGR